MKDKHKIYVTTLFSGFWLWLILIQNNPQGMDLLDAIIHYVATR